MEYPAYARFERKNADEPVVLVEKPSATRAIIKRRGNLNNFGSIIIVQRNNAPGRYGELVATGKTGGKYFLADRKTRCSNRGVPRNACCAPGTEVVLCILSRYFCPPAAAIVDDLQALRGCGYMTVRNQPFSSQ